MQLLTGVPERLKVHLHEEMFLAPLTSLRIWRYWKHEDDELFFRQVCHLAMVEHIATPGVLVWEGGTLGRTQGWARAVLLSTVASRIPGFAPVIIMIITIVITIIMIFTIIIMVIICIIVIMIIVIAVFVFFWGGGGVRPKREAKMPLCPARSAPKFTSSRTAPWATW